LQPRNASNQSMSQRPHLEISSACLPRRPAVAYLFLVRWSHALTFAMWRRAPFSLVCWPAEPILHLPPHLRVALSSTRRGTLSMRLVHSYPPTRDTLAARACSHYGSVQMARSRACRRFQSTGHEELDAISVAAFSKWRFYPGQFKVVRIPITYLGRYNR
jgi:hypothetical protein